MLQVEAAGSVLSLLSEDTSHRSLVVQQGGVRGLLRVVDILEKAETRSEEAIENSRQALARVALVVPPSILGYQTTINVLTAIMPLLK
jgi:hypothetical protein